MPPQRTPRQGTQDDREFSGALARLKAAGGALLVVGDFPRDLYSDVCYRMLGYHGSQRRYRLFVSTDAEHPPASTCAHSPSSGPRGPQTQVVQYTTAQRNVDTSHQRLREGRPTTVVDGDLGDLGRTISGTIDHVTDQRTLEPAELRLCFDSLGPLLDHHDTDEVFRFLHLLVGRLKAVDGMGHFHLPQSPGTETVLRMQALFDIVVELRLREHQLEQRWHLLKADLTTAWLPVETQLPADDD